MLTEIGDYLEVAGVGTVNTPTAVGTIFKSTRPDTPDDCLTLYQYNGNAPEYVQDVVGPDVEVPQLQVMARARSYPVAEQLAYAAWLVLSAVRNQVLGTVYFRSIMPNSSPGYLGRDANDRHLIGFNATVAKEVPVGASS